MSGIHWSRTARGAAVGQSQHQRSVVSIIGDAFRLARFVLLSFAMLVVAQANGKSEEVRSPFSVEQRHGIEEIVREYLLKNPEVVRDAIAELERRTEQLQKASQAKMLEQYRDQLVSSRGSTVIGNPKGSVSIVAFFDYNCPYCRASVDDIQKLIDGNPELRVVMRELPILGRDSTDASRVALAVARQTGDLTLRARYYTVLMKSKGQVNGSLALSTATGLGLDGPKIKNDLRSAEIDAILRDNLATAEALGITGTPAFVIGDEIIVGAVGPDRMQAAIAANPK